jgi:nucleotide-binding universal stress UspA family protein
VLHDAKVPVWTSAHAPEASHRAHPKARHIVTALDLKAESRRVLDCALKVAEDAGATVEMLHVADEGEIDSEKTDNDMRALLSDAAKLHPGGVQVDSGLDVEVVNDVGDIAKLVRKLALQKRADLVVIGRGIIQSAFGGFRTNAYAIIRESPCPVLSV